LKVKCSAWVLFDRKLKPTISLHAATMLHMVNWWKSSPRWITITKLKTSILLPSSLSWTVTKIEFLPNLYSINAAQTRV
jgi:hypothetical protein